MRGRLVRIFIIQDYTWGEMGTEIRLKLKCPSNRSPSTPPSTISFNNATNNTWLGTRRAGDAGPEIGILMRTPPTNLISLHDPHSSTCCRESSSSSSESRPNSMKHWVCPEGSFRVQTYLAGSVWLRGEREQCNLQLTQLSVSPDVIAPISLNKQQVQFQVLLV